MNVLLNCNKKRLLLNDYRNNYQLLKQKEQQIADAERAVSIGEIEMQFLALKEETIVKSR